MLELSHIYKKYEGLTVLKDLSLYIEGPCIIGITGVSGCGKSTLLNIIGGLDDDFEGEVKFQNINILKNRDYYRLYHVGFLYQRYHLLTKWSIKDNIYLYDYLSHQKGKQDISCLCDRLDLKENIRKKASRLSGGQQSRYALVRSLRKEPSILLCDEPTSALDEDSAKKVMNLLREYAKKKIVIIVSHDVSLLYEYCQEVLHLEDGKLTNHYISSSTRLGSIKKGKSTSKGYSYYVFIKNSFLARKERYIMTLFAIGFSCFCLLLTINLAIGLKNEVFKEIQKIFPQQCLSVKSQEPLTATTAMEITDNSEYFYGAYLNLPNIELVGISQDSATHQYLFIGDNTRLAHEQLSLLKGKLPEKENEILLSKNTYERLFNNSYDNQQVSALYKWNDLEKVITLDVVGVVDEVTTMDTIYRLSLSENILLEKAWNVELNGDYLMIYCKEELDQCKEYLQTNFSGLECKIVGETITQEINDILIKVNYFLLGVSLIVMFAVFLLLAMAIYLNIVEKIKEIGLCQMMGAKQKDMIFLQFLEVFVFSLIGSLLGMAIHDGFTHLLNTTFLESFGFSMKLALSPEIKIILVGIMTGIGLLSSIVPIHLLKKISLLDSLYKNSY